MGEGGEGENLKRLFDLGLLWTLALAGGKDYSTTLGSTPMLYVWRCGKTRTGKKTKGEAKKNALVSLHFLLIDGQKLCWESRLKWAKHRQRVMV